MERGVGSLAIEWIKTKALTILVVACVAEAAAIAWLAWGNGIYVDKRTFVTSTTTSSANSSSGSVAINVNGGQYWGRDGFRVGVKVFESVEQAALFVDGLDEGARYGVQVVPFGGLVHVMYRETAKGETKRESKRITVDGAEVDALPGAALRWADGRAK